MLKNFLILIFFICFASKLVMAQTNAEIFFGQKPKLATIEKVTAVDACQLDTGENIVFIGLKAPPLPVLNTKKDQDQYGFEVKEVPSPEIPFSELALEHTKSWLEGKKVRIEFDRQSTDVNDRTWAYVFLGEEGVFVNAELIRQGYADLSIEPPNNKYEDQLREAYREARREQRGLQVK